MKIFQDRQKIKALITIRSAENNQKKHDAQRMKKIAVIMRKV